MNEEVIRILEMVKNNTITPEDGEKLLAAIGANEPLQKKKPHYSMLRIHVDATDPKKEEQAKVSVNLPLSIAKKAAGLMALVPKEAKQELLEKGIDLDSFDLAELIEMFENGEITEDLVNVDTGDETNGARVRIYVD